MPLGPGVKYRVKTFGSGKKVRLAFRGNRVIETKSLQTGEVTDLRKSIASHIRKKRLKKG